MNKNLLESEIAQVRAILLYKCLKTVERHNLEEYLRDRIKQWEY